MANTTDKKNPNLIFVGLKINREPVEFFNDGEKITVAPVASQVSTKTVKTKDGERTERTATPFYHPEPARIIRTLGSRLYKEPTAKQLADFEDSQSEKSS